MSIKVLVADDSITIQKVIGIIFGGEEYALTVVDNGKAAVDKAREIVPDILLIDALMPGMSGYEVAEAVRSTPSLSSKPILILTGSFEPFDEEKAKKCGADDFIAKPFESQQIITKVKELLELGSARSQSVQSLSQQPEQDINEFTEVSAPILEAPAPAFDQHPAEPQPSAPADIWGAFTPEFETPAAEASVLSVQPSPPAVSTEPDVFAIVSEEADEHLMQTSIPPASSPQHTGSQWIPVEENTFEFEEEDLTAPPQAGSTDQAVPVQDTSFGDISFEEEVAPPVASTFLATPEQEFFPPAPDSSEPPDFADFETPAPLFETPAATFVPLTDPTPSFTVPVEPAPSDPLVAAVETSSTTTAEMSEEQLKAVLSGVSKEVIERIVWEIVPDLAEAMIREAIRKIKEGV